MAREMKDSGVEWIGNIPNSWNILPINNGFTERREKVSDIEWEPLSVTKSGIVRQLEHAAKSDNHNDRKKVCVGDFAINSRSDRKESCGLSSLEGSVSLINTVLIPNVTVYSPDYIKYLLKNYGFAEEFYRWGTGIVADLWSTNFERMKNIKLPLPPLAEQQKIADFLDEKVKEIDNAIEKTKETIELYKKYKQAVITEAVTKGILQYEIKDSRYPYIGEINKKWHITKITHLLDYSHPYAIGDGDHGSINAEDYANEGIPFIRVKNLGWATDLDLTDCVYISKEQNETIKNSTLKPGDILFAKTGATIGKTAFVPNNIPVSNTTSHVGKITIDNNKHNPKFFYYVLSSQIAYRQFWAIASLKTTRPELSIDEIKTLMVTVPSTKDEENSIVEWLDNICKYIDSIISQKFELIDEYNSYKKSVIYEYVTGKKEVLDNVKNEWQ